MKKLKDKMGSELSAPAPNDADNGKVARPERQAGRIQSVAIASRFLRILAEAEEAKSLGVLAQLADTGNSTAHRYLQSLVQEGLAVQDPASGHYDLGPAALSIGIAAVKRIEPVEIAASHMKQLASDYAASGGIAIWTDRGPTLVRWYRSALFSISSVGLGDVLPIDNSACGLVFQAYLPQSRVDKARAQQPEAFRGGSPPDPDLLRQIRETGWHELKGHLLSHVRGEAVAVFDAQREVSCVMTTISNLGHNPSDQERMALRNAGLKTAQATGISFDDGPKAED